MIRFVLYFCGTSVGTIELFKNDELKGNTITFTYLNDVIVQFYKNIDGFGGDEGKISCSLSVFSPNIVTKNIVGSSVSLITASIAKKLVDDGL